MGFELECVITIEVARDFKRKGETDEEYRAWWKRVRGGPFVRPTLEPPERTLFYRLMRDMPTDRDAAVAFVRKLGAKEPRLARHFRGECFECAGKH